MNQPLRRLPGGQPSVLGWVPVGAVFRPRKKARLSSDGLHNPSSLEAIKRCVLGLGEEDRTARVGSIEPKLLIPGNRPSRVSVEVAFLFGENLVKGLVDDGQGCPNAHPRAVGLKYVREATENRHSRTNGGLGKIDRRDVAVLKGSQCLR